MIGKLLKCVDFNVYLQQMTEVRGLICRDDTVEGLRFFDNLIMKYEPEVLS